MTLNKGIIGKFALGILVGASLLSNGSAMADNYSPGDFLKLDLNHAVMSPKLLGPSAQFEPVQIEAKAEPADKADPVAATLPVKTAAAPTPVRRARVAALRRPARPHRNPLDAYAADTRIQVWPCKSGGICSWQK